MIYNNSVFLIVSIINQIATREINMFSGTLLGYCY